jgi:hypothetical protein
VASNRAAIAADIAAKREQFNTSVGELEHKLDFDAQRTALREKITGSYQANPLPWWLGVGALAVVVVSTVAWAVFGDD